MRSHHKFALGLVSKHTELRVPRGFDAKDQRFAARLGTMTSIAEQERLKAEGEWLSIRATGRVLGCSKSTVQKYLHQKFFRSRGARAKRAGRRRPRISSQSVRDFIQLCRKWHDYRRFYVGRDTGQNFLKRFLAEASPHRLRSIPPKLTIADTAGLLGCSPATVRRMIYSRELFATRRTPHRWMILKKSFDRSTLRRRKGLSKEI